MTTCTVSRPYFTTEAKPYIVTIADAAGNVMYKGILSPKTFSTNSMGWNTSGKAEFNMTPSTPVKCQVGINLTIVGSKEVPLS